MEQAAVDDLRRGCIYVLYNAATSFECVMLDIFHAKSIFALYLTLNTSYLDYLGNKKERNTRDMIYMPSFLNSSHQCLEMLSAVAALDLSTLRICLLLTSELSLTRGLHPPNIHMDYSCSHRLHPPSFLHPASISSRSCLT